MSRVGKQPIPVPEQAEVLIDGNRVTVKGPKGELSRELPGKVDLKLENGFIKVERRDESRESRSLHGLTRTLLANMVEGVTKGFEKKLEVVGVGFRAEKKAKALVLKLGFSHDVIFQQPEGIELKVEGNNVISVSGVDKELVGQVAAAIRALRKPEPYKGKGIRYVGESIRDWRRRRFMKDRQRKDERRIRRHLRVRKKISGTPERPRLVVFRSLKHIYAQLVDDTRGMTLTGASSVNAAVRAQAKDEEGKVGMARIVGRVLAERAREKGITKVAFDRGGYLYHGRVRAVAEGAREGGLEF